MCSLFYSKRLFSGYSRYSPLDKNHNFDLFLFLNNMGDKYLHNFGAKFYNCNVAMATFLTGPKWRPGLEMLQILILICHP